MRSLRSLKPWLVLLLCIAVGLGTWFALDGYRHRILVLLPDGSRAGDPSVLLDYDPVSYNYHPTRLDGRNGTVYIPRSRAYGRGWETMKISASQGKTRYVAQRYPSECRYPMSVTLEELPPVVPPPPSKFEQVMELFDRLRQSIR